LGEMHWESQVSGIKIPQNIANEVEKEFKKACGRKNYD